jgi:radical SAM-linked protein
VYNPSTRFARSGYVALWPRTCCERHRSGPILEKLQVFFAKEQELCFLSHHDLMRAFHRALRRADLPVRLTGGYNPRPRVVFPHALEVGIPSEDEVAEIELEKWLPPAVFGARLSAALPRGLTVREVKLLPPKRKGCAAVEVVYVAELGEGSLDTVREGMRRFLEADAWTVERRRPDGRTREIDLRPQVLDLALEGTGLAMRLRLGAPGAARPREVLAAVLGRGGDPMFDVRLRKTKTVLTAPA